MSPLVDLTADLSRNLELTPGGIAAAAEALADVGVSGEDKAGFLVALSAKGETAGEVAGFAREFRERALDPGVHQWSDRAIDIVGTGGDHAGGFNISSVVVFVLASSGAIVMKHGNRGITSKCGSADLMAALGVDLEAKPDKQRRALEQLGFAYFFAPSYHPAFRHIMPVRKALAARGQRTVFNILGPLINPGRPAHVLLGAYSESWVSRLADALDALGTAASLAVHGSLGPDRGIDELTTASLNRVRGAGRLRSIDTRWRAADFGMAEARFDELRGGDLAANLSIVESILDGRGPSGLVDTIALNSAAALWIQGRTSSVVEGIEIARDLILGGAVRKKIEATREFYLRQ